MNKEKFFKSIICIFLVLIIIGVSKRYIANKKCIVPKKMNKLIDQGFYEKAIEIGKKELEHDPKNYLIYFAIGNAYMHKQEYDNALENLKMSLRLNKNTSSTSYFCTQIQIALCHRAKGMSEEAIKILRDITTHNSPNNRVKELAYKALLSIYIQKGMLREAALVALKKAGKDNPDEELVQKAIEIVEREYKKYKDIKGERLFEMINSGGRNL